jgi:peroxiredoxin
MKSFPFDTQSVARAIQQVAARHLPLVVLMLSIGVNVLLASRLLQAQRPPARGPAVGATVRPFQVTSPTGDAILVKYAAPMSTIVYHFSPACGWCERNWDNVRTLIQQTKGRYRFVGVSLTAVSPQFMREHHLDFEVAANVSPDMARQYGLAGTPQTIVVSSEQRVVKTWWGAYVGLQARDIGTYFSVKLPGLLSARPVEQVQ